GLNTKRVTQQNPSTNKTPAFNIQATVKPSYFQIFFASVGVIGNRDELCIFRFGQPQRNDIQLPLTVSQVRSHRNVCQLIAWNNSPLFVPSEAYIWRQTGLTQYFHFNVILQFLAEVTNYS